MDRIVDYISSYSHSLDFNSLPAAVVHQAKRILLDSLGCGFGGYGGEPAVIARRMVEGVSCPEPATVILSGQKTTPELATFASGVAVRYLDFNDAYTGKATAHPSDVFVPALTLAAMRRAGGKVMIAASVLAYEVCARLCDVADIYARHFDYSTFGAISAACGAAKVLGLSRQQTAHAVALAAASNIGLRQIRRGEVSMWKGCAFPYTCQNGVFAARLAAEGLTGPAPVFEGESGFIKAVSGPFELEKFGGDGRPFRIMESVLKRFPAGLYSQTAIDAALRIRPEVKSMEDIAGVTIHCVTQAFNIMAGDAEKWHPQTRESADHSLPYVVATALMHGGLRVEHFSEEAIRDSRVVALMQKVKVQPSEECNRAYPEACPNIVEVTTADGSSFREKVDYHRGHFKNPMSDAEVEEKFASQAGGMVSASRIKQIADAVWGLDKLEDVGSLMALLKL